MISHQNPKNSGFTLVELLVVVVIIAALAALGLTLGPRMMAKSKATESMQNLRQIGPLLVTYAAENSMVLPAIKGPVPRDNGVVDETQWNEVCLAMLYPDVDPEDFRTEKWWEQNKKVVIKNPLLKESAKPRGWTPLNPGYAFNEMISVNLEAAAGRPEPGHEALVRMKVPLASVPEPHRTPLIAPCDNYYFRFDDEQIGEFSRTRSTLKELLVEGKIQVLFMDAHLESIVPNEYASRRLHLMPLAPVNEQ